MIRMHNLPDNIKRSLKPYYKDNENPEVFPSKFNIDGEIYYFFNFAPATEQLIMKENGIVPPHQEVQKIDLIATSYNHSIDTIVNIGSKWAKSKKEKNYQKLVTILHELKNRLEPIPSNIQNDLESYKLAAENIIKQQEIINHSVENGRKLWQSTNNSELVTEENQKEMRTYIVQMCRAAYRQNEIQLNTEDERNSVWGFVSSKRWPLNIKAWNIYRKLLPYQKNMMKNTMFNTKEAEEIGKLVEEDLPLEKGKNAQDILDHLRNPR